MKFSNGKFSNGSMNFGPAVFTFDGHQAVIYLDVNTKFRSRMLIGVRDTAADGKTYKRTDVQMYRRRDGRTDGQTEPITIHDPLKRPCKKKKN